jgi:hypothetical protein|nr:MAG TPA: hypothetical protein [Siphoviridae sp. ctvzh6]
MTKEQAIERLKKMIQINNGVIKEARKNGDIFAMQLTADLDTDSIAIETVLSMLKEKDKQIEQYQNMLATNDMLHVIECENKDKIIDLMANEIANNITNTCPLEDYNYDLNCENKCNDNYKECWKQYFENKAKELLNK